MAMIHDFSDWAESLFEHSIALITYKGIFEYDVANKEIQLSNNSGQIQKLLVSQPVEAHIYWISLGVGVECLAKAVLLKHEKMEIKKRRLLEKIPPIKTEFANYQEMQKYREETKDKSAVDKVYEYVASSNLSAESNRWLKAEFEDKGIEHPFEINTPTLGVIYNAEIPKLRESRIISDEECTLLKKSLELFTNMRRNVDGHVFLKLRVVGSINKDIEDVYIPMINLLIKIYFRELAMPV